jgi:hypothetical protein
MRAILILLSEGGIPDFKYLGSNDVEVAFSMNWIKDNFSGRPEGNAPGPAPGEPVSLAGGNRGGLHPTFSETTSTYGFHVER